MMDSRVETILRRGWTPTWVLVFLGLVLLLFGAGAAVAYVQSGERTVVLFVGLAPAVCIGSCLNARMTLNRYIRQSMEKLGANAEWGRQAEGE